MPHPRFTNEEIARVGEEIHTMRLRSQLENDHRGQVVIIDIESGEFEIGYDSLAANKRALAKHPGAALYGIRVGFPFVESISREHQPRASAESISREHQPRASAESTD